jgi:hypothetical protein
VLAASLALAVAACQGGHGRLATDSTGTTSTPATGVPTTTSVVAPDTSATVTTATTTTQPVSGSGRRPIPLDRLSSPRSAAATARTLARVEVGLRGSDRGTRLLQRLGREQQLAYRALAKHPKWATIVVKKVPVSVRSAVQANIDAGSALSTLTGSAPTALPDWTILEPKPAATLRGYYHEAEQASGVSWAYLAAIHLVETRMGRIHGNSSAGAQGPMQFLPSTFAEYGNGGDINDDHDAILAAGRFLAANGASTDIDHALFRYNNDDRYVAAVKAYAGVILADERAYDGYYQWRVFYATVDGAFLLPEGYRAG